ncbi:MAG: hypothetical protein AAF092_10535 [Pseudomonadota bacterium]
MNVLFQATNGVVSAIFEGMTPETYARKFGVRPGVENVIGYGPVTMGQRVEMPYEPPAPEPEPSDDGGDGGDGPAVPPAAT